MSTVRFLHGKFAHLACQMIRSARVHVPSWVDGIGWSVACLASRLMSGQGSLLLVAFAILADAEEVLLEAAMTAGLLPQTSVA